LIFAVTGTYALFAYFQWRSLNASVDVSRGMARIAEQANEVSRDAEQRQLRAYMVLDQSNITRFVAGQTIEFHGVIKNTGQTPAYDIDAYSAIMYDAFPLAYPFPAVATDTLQQSSAVLGANGTVHTVVPTKDAPTPEIIAAIQTRIIKGT
jgi:hypothetical protein